MSRCFHMHILRPNKNYIFKDIWNNISFICYYKVIATTQNPLFFMYCTSLKRDGNGICSWQNVSKAEKNFSIKFYTKAEMGLLALDPPWSSRCCFQLQQVFIQKQLPPRSLVPHGSHTRTWLHCINERPDLELQQKYNTQLLFERTKERQLSPFPAVISKGCRHMVHDGPTWEAWSNNHISQLPQMYAFLIIMLML